MKCSSCGTDIPSGNTCPSCGALNIPFNAPTQTPSVEQPQQTVQPQVEQPVQEPTQAVAQEQPATQSQSVIQEPASAVNPAATSETPDVSTLGIDDTGSADQVNVSADMSAPILDVNNEDLTSNVSNINANDDAIYDPNATENISTPDNIKPESNVVTFDIPAVKKDPNGSVPITGIEELNAGATVGDASNHTVQPTSKKGFKINLNLNNKSNLVYFGIIVLALITGIIIGKLYFSQTIQTNTPRTTQTKVQTVADGKNGETLVNGYKFKIPTSYSFDKSGNGLFVYDADATYRIYSKIYDGTFADFSAAIESIKASLTDADITVNDTKELKVGEKNYILFEITTNMQNRLIAFTNAIDEKVVYIEILTADNNYNYDTLDVINDILVNAEKQEKINSLEKIDVYDNYNLINKTVDAYKQINN